jgi:hypothetical protein
MLPAPRYVAPGLLEELDVDPIAALADVPEAVMRRVINDVITSVAGSSAYLAVRTSGGLTLLRERGPAESAKASEALVGEAAG